MSRKMPWTEKTSVNEFGMVIDFTYPYPLTYKEYSKWRTHIPNASTCEIPGCKQDDWRYVYDHCHLHDVIRGEVCNFHNTFVLFYSNRVSDDWYKEWILRCKECASIIDLIKPKTPGQWRDALLPGKWREFNLSPDQWPRFPENAFPYEINEGLTVLRRKLIPNEIWTGKRWESIDQLSSETIEKCLRIFHHNE